MGFMPIACPICGRKLATINDKMITRATKQCHGCRIRIHYEYDPKGKRLTAGPE